MKYLIDVSSTSMRKANENQLTMKFQLPSRPPKTVEISKKGFSFFLLFRCLFNISFFCFACLLFAEQTLLQWKAATTFCFDSLPYLQQEKNGFPALPSLNYETEHKSLNKIIISARDKRNAGMEAGIGEWDMASDGQAGQDKHDKLCKTKEIQYECKHTHTPTHPDIHTHTSIPTHTYRCVKGKAPDGDRTAQAGHMVAWSLARQGPGSQ